MQRRPLVVFTIYWYIGSSIAAGLGSRGVLLAGLSLAAAWLALLLSRRVTWPLAAACLFAFGAAAGERMWVDARNVSGISNMIPAEVNSDATSYAAEIKGIIHSAIDIDGDRVQFRMTTDAVRLGEEQSALDIRENLLVQLKLSAETELAAAAGWHRGQHIIIKGELTQPSEATNFGGFDYRHYLENQRIHWLFKASGAASLHISAGHNLNMAFLLSYIDSMRSALGSRMDALYPAEQSGYMKGLVIGMREDLDPDRFRQFSRLGLTHILAISGLHIGVFLYVLRALLRILRITRERMFMILILAVPFYVLLAGCSPSVTRAGIMAMLGLAAARMNKLKDGLHLLAAAAWIMLVWDPYLLSSVGFQLSFLVTAGLILGVPAVRCWLPQGQRSKAVFDLIAVTIVAQVISFPLTVYYFNQFHMLSFLANFILVPFISSIVMPLGGTSLVLDAIWHPAGKLVAMAASLGNKLTFGIVLKLSEMQSFRMIWGTPSLIWVFCMYAAIILSLFLLRSTAERKKLNSNESESLQTSEMADTQPLEESDLAPLYTSEANARPKGSFRRILYFIGIVSPILPLMWAYYPSWRDDNAYVSFLDVGQGDSILIRTSAGKHILIDGGGLVAFRKAGDEWRNRRDPFEIGQKVVVPLLQQRGVHSIDLLVLSHMHSDHIKGLIAVLGQVPVKRILWNGTLVNSPDTLSILKKAVGNHIPLYRAEEGLSWRLDKSSSMELIGANPDIVNNDTTKIAKEKDQNGQSVALIIHLYNRTFLFAGDADKAEEQSLLSQYQREHASQQHESIDVLKVSHHGSKTSTSEEWLTYWNPSIAVISVGRNNSYGHPNINVLERLTEFGAKIQRTDVNGEVQFRVTKQNQLEMREKFPVNK